jgi:glycosyltransferase involved in cell wall biosynthesis
MKTALVHDWLIGIAGGEKVSEDILNVYPADIFTLVHDPEKMKGTNFGDFKIETSFVQNLPWGVKKYKSYLPLFPLAIEQFNLNDYDLVISSSFCVAKGALTNHYQKHICYCHSPIRYAWDLYHTYLTESNLNTGIKGYLAKYFLHKIRNWDVTSANRVDHYIANSNFVAKRIKKIYNRDAEVIHPPVDTKNFTLNTHKENFYLTASRMVPYKKIDLIAEAFSNMPDKKLVIIGDGPEMDKVKKVSKGNIEILGYQSTATLIDYMQRAKGFVFAAEEDFGIMPVEAQACGTPLIAFGKGGVLDSVIDGKTGTFFYQHTVKDIIESVKSFERTEFDYNVIRQHAESFDRAVFRSKFKTFVDSKL